MTTTTTSKREQLRSVMDKFATFYWNNENMFDNYGAFIINDKREGLKFFNGPSFSNEYSRPQFETAAGTLTGINFDIGRLPTLKIGLYWFDIDTYRKFLNALNPYIIGNLRFDFNEHYCYYVKVAKIGESVRYIVGTENNEPMYYTELTVDFEIQGTPCAHFVENYEWDTQITDTDNATFVKIISTKSDSLKWSDLKTPFKYQWTIPLLSWSTSPVNSFNYKLEIEGETLFELTLHNLTFGVSDLTLEYDSEDGLIYLIYGSRRELLTLQTTTTTGEYLVKHLQVKKFYFGGLFNYAQYTAQYTPSINMTVLTSEGPNPDYVKWIDNIIITCCGRTNTL